MDAIKMDLPFDREKLRKLRAGDRVLLTGTMLTGRDAAHKRMIALLDAERELPFTIEGETIYYVGPAPASPGHAVGPAGPTTSGRMDAYAPRLLDKGLCAMIGKGRRNPAVIDAIKRNGAVYFGATGGAAALLSRCIEKSEVLAWEDLASEAVHRFTVKDFPVIVLIDSLGTDLYETGPALYREEA